MCVGLVLVVQKVVDCEVMVSELFDDIPASRRTPRTSFAPRVGAAGFLSNSRVVIESFFSTAVSLSKT